MEFTTTRPVTALGCTRGSRHARTRGRTFTFPRPLGRWVPGSTGRQAQGGSGASSLGLIPPPEGAPHSRAGGTGDRRTFSPLLFAGGKELRGRIRDLGSDVGHRRAGLCCQGLWLYTYMWGHTAMYSRTGRQSSHSEEFYDVGTTSWTKRRCKISLVANYNCT